MILVFPLGANVSVDGVSVTLPAGGRMSFDDVEIVASPTFGVQGVAIVSKGGTKSTMHFDKNFISDKTK